MGAYYYPPRNTIQTFHVAPYRNYLPTPDLLAHVYNDQFCAAVDVMMTHLMTAPKFCRSQLTSKEVTSLKWGDWEEVEMESQGDQIPLEQWFWELKSENTRVTQGWEPLL